MPNGAEPVIYERLAKLEQARADDKEDQREMQEGLKDINKRLSKLEKLLLAIMVVSAVGGSDALMNVVGKLTSLVGG